MRKYNLAIVGINTLLGQEMLKVLAERNFPINVLRLLVSEHIGERTITFNQADYVVDLVSPDSFQGMDLVFFLEKPSVSLNFVESAANKGAIVIDNSSAFALDKRVPLIVPEVNFNLLNKKPEIIASPTTQSIFLSLILKPIFLRVGLKRVVVTSFHCVGEMGKEAIKELRLQAKDFLSTGPPEEEVLSNFTAFNLLPSVGEISTDGYTDTEIAISSQTKKIINDPQLTITTTSLRLPIIRGNSAVVHIETKKRITAEEARIAYRNAPYVMLIDEPEKAKYPTPLQAETNPLVLIGRIRENKSMENVLELFGVGDNLRKGSVVNIVQIAEKLIENNFI